MDRSSSRAQQHFSQIARPLHSLQAFFRTLLLPALINNTIISRYVRVLMGSMVLRPLQEDSDRILPKRSQASSLPPRMRFALPLSER